MNHPSSAARRRRAAALGIGIAVSVAMLAAGAGAQEAPPAYTGDASAHGVRLTLNIAGFPAIDTPFDGGGPTAQASGDSLGSGSGFASFPDPGELIITAPGLVTGLINSGAAGLPPIELPSLPDYPLFVRASANSTPSASLGSGPYVLQADSEPGASSASASAGFSTDAGDAALVTSSASVTATDGSVVSTATSRIQGVTVGPLTIGEIRSTATMTISADGTRSPASSIEIAAVKIGGLSVAIDEDGVSVAGTRVPLPVNDILRTILSPFGLSAEILTSQVFPDRVIAPALVIRGAFETPAIPSVGQFSGTYEATLGAATASLVAAEAEDSDPPPLIDQVEGDGSVPLDPIVADPPPSVVDPPSPADPVSQAAPASEVSRIEPLIGLWSLRALYLTVIGGGVAAVAVGQLVRLLGVRSWISQSG